MCFDADTGAHRETTVAVKNAVLLGRAQARKQRQRPAAAHQHRQSRRSSRTRGFVHATRFHVLHLFTYFCGGAQWPI